MKRVSVILLTLTAVLLFAAPAFAGSRSVLSGHSSTPPAGNNLGVTAAKAKPTHSSPGIASSVPSGTLPFTGVDLAYIALGGVAIVGLGYALRRSSRTPS